VSGLHRLDSPSGDLDWTFIAKDVARIEGWIPDIGWHREGWPNPRPVDYFLKGAWKRGC
jgi:hypothetical protein